MHVTVKAQYPLIQCCILTSSAKIKAAISANNASRFVSLRLSHGRRTVAYCSSHNLSMTVVTRIWLGNPKSLSVSTLNPSLDDTSARTVGVKV
jgi:hypothetical protein